MKVFEPKSGPLIAALTYCLPAVFRQVPTEILRTPYDHTLSWLQSYCCPHVVCIVVQVECSISAFVFIPIVFNHNFLVSLFDLGTHSVVVRSPLKHVDNLLKKHYMNRNLHFKFVLILVGIVGPHYQLIHN